MKTAVIITGQARTFARCWKTQREAVYRKLENPTFFFSLAAPTDPATDDALAALVASYPGRVHIERVDQPAMPEDLRERFERESFHAPYFRSVPVEAIWKQAWHMARGWDFVNDYASKGEFQRFVRIRPDLHFHNWTPPECETKYAHTETGPREIRSPSGVYAPWWGSWGGCPDRFAYIVGFAAAEQYFTLFHRINELIAEGCAYHPETMLARALERAGVPLFRTMDADFTTIRAVGDKRPHDGPSYNNRDLFAYINARLGEADR